MSTRNFYNAMTPGSSLSEEMMFGKSAYTLITNSELNSNFIVNMNKLPVNGSNLLNAINEHGLLSYTDFHFLLLLMSTPTRYLDIIFHGFDISADGSVEAKVTLYQMSINCQRCDVVFFYRSLSMSWHALPMQRSIRTS